jgi:hypothetical protein
LEHRLRFRSRSGLRLFGALFYLPDPRARSAVLGLVRTGHFLTTRDGRTLFVPDPSQFVFGEKPVEVFQKQGLLIDGGILFWMPQRQPD